MGSKKWLVAGRQGHEGRYFEIELGLPISYRSYACHLRLECGAVVWFGTLSGLVRWVEDGGFVYEAVPNVIQHRKAGISRPGVCVTKVTF